MARSSASLKADFPLRSSFSRGRSSSDQVRMGNVDCSDMASTFLNGVYDTLTTADAFQYQTLKYEIPFYIGSCGGNFFAAKTVCPASVGCGTDAYQGCGN